MRSQEVPWHFASEECHWSCCRDSYHSYQQEVDLFFVLVYSTLCACAYMHILSNHECLFLGSMQVSLFVLSQHPILAIQLEASLFTMRSSHVCLIFKVQQYFVNLLYDFHYLLHEILYTIFPAHEVLEEVTPKSDCAAAIPKVATKSA